MEMEHINENTIRVLIGADDLEERGITFLDLLSSQNQVENFFYSVLEELDVHDTFRETDAVTFQVMPRGNGLELYITKGSPAEAVASLEQAEIEDSGVLEHVAQFIKQHLLRKREGKATADLPPDREVPEPLQDLSCVFRAASFEDLILLAQNVTISTGRNSVYRYRDTYYLDVSFRAQELSDGAADYLFLQIVEYLEPTPIASDIMAEHGTLIVADNALAHIKQYFA